MNEFLDRMERKFGRYAIHNLMFYIIGIYVIGAMIGMINPAIYYDYLSLDIYKVLHGQIWRLITFILAPDTLGSATGFNFFFFLINLYFYWIIGKNLESVWGAFRFNMYYLSGIVLNIIAAFIMYFITGDPFTGYYMGLTYVNDSLLLAFCAMFPDSMVLFMFVLPLKMKYLGIFYGALITLNIIQAVIGGQYYVAIAIIVGLANFFIFYFSNRKARRPFTTSTQRNFRRGQKHRTNSNFHVVGNDAGPASSGRIARHKCAICGRTELTNPELEFRFCSKCDGNYEYCSDHLYTHQHIQKVHTDPDFKPDNR